MIRTVPVHALAAVQGKPPLLLLVAGRPSLRPAAEGVNAALLPFTVVDSYKALLWVKIFPNLRVRTDLAVNTGGEIAWAVRKNSPLLLAEINACTKKFGPNSAFFGEVM